MKPVYKTTITVTVLHQDPERIGQMEPADIFRECYDGEFIGQAVQEQTTEVPLGQIGAELEAIGNDGTFFEDPDEKDWS